MPASGGESSVILIEYWMPDPVLWLDQGIALEGRPVLWLDQGIVLEGRPVLWLDQGIAVEGRPGRA